MPGMIGTDAATHESQEAGATLVSVRVWDLPTRLFHWVLVLLIAASWLTQHYERMHLHMVFGYATAALLIFRLAWGFIGSATARFGGFVRGPRAACRHLVRVLRREPDTEISHNAAGGFMVLLMLALLIVQVVTGACANDEVSTEGPFAELVGASTSDWLSHIHAANFRLLEAAMAVHVLAILLYRIAKGQNLIGPMISGRKWLPATVPAPRMVGWPRALATLAIAAAIVAAAVLWFGSGGT